MALETGTYLNDLVVTNPTSTDPKSAGDDHLRLIKSTLKNTFAGFTGGIMAIGTEAAGATTNDFTVTVAPAPAAYVTGMRVVFSATHANNSSATTLQINALGTKTLLGVDGAALASGDITSGEVVEAYYNGTSFFLLSGNDRGARDGETWTGTHDFTGGVLTVPSATLGAQPYTKTQADALLATYAPLASPTLTGDPKAPTPSFGDRDTSIPTTLWVGTEFAPLASPALTGTPTVPTATIGTNTTQAASTAFVYLVAMAAGLPATFLQESARTSNTILGATDKFTFVNVTSGTFTQTLTAAATLGNGWACWFKNSGTGIITIDPNGAETIDARTTITVYPGESFLIECNGTSFQTLGRLKVVAIASTTVGSAVATVDVETGFTDPEIIAIQVKVIGMSGASAASPQLLWKHAGAYAATSYKYASSVISSTLGAPTQDTATAGTFVQGFPSNQSTTGTINGLVDLINIQTANAGEHLVLWRLHGEYGGTSGAAATCMGQGWNTGGSAVQGLRFKYGAGNVDAGTFVTVGYRA